MPAYRIRLWTFLIAWLLAAPVSLAQTDGNAPKRYVEFPIGEDFEALLKMRLQSEKDLGPLKDLFNKIAADPKKFPLDAEHLKNLPLDDPRLKKAIQEWTARDPALSKALRAWIKQQPKGKDPQTMQRWQQELDSILKQPAAKEVEIKPLPPAKAVEPGAPADDPLAKIAENAMKQAEDTPVGDWLKNSPAWQRAFEDMRDSLNRSSGAKGDWPAWANKLRVPDQKLWQLGEQTFEKLRRLPAPNFERRPWFMPAMDAVPLPSLGPPALPIVTTPALPTLPTLGQSASWLLFLLLLALFGWQMKRWVKRSSPQALDPAALGPWPVRPEMVATGSELVQAFDYLALLTLGPGVQSWNHHAIARQWSELAPAYTGIAALLAQLYEEARYTNRADNLPEAQRERARHCLQQLAEAL